MLHTIRTVITVFIVLVITVAFRTPSTGEGKALYEHHCAHCHGADGTKGMFGARNLQKSTLPDSAIIVQIKNGKRIMPAFRKKFTQEQIAEVSAYIKSFRKL
jgi:mono/diheme cytochrome c family protein